MTETPQQPPRKFATAWRSGKLCPECRGDMEWDICPELDCQGGIDGSDCIGEHRCSMCEGRGGWFYCPTCGYT